MAKPQGSISQTKGPNDKEILGVPPKARRLTEAEVSEKRAKNLCFCCDERYTPNHQCKKKYMHAIWFQECDGTEDDIDDEGEEVNQGPVISLCAMGSLNEPSHQTMRLVGRDKGRLLHILVDFGQHI